MSTPKISPLQKMNSSRTRMEALVKKMQTESDLFDSFVLELEAEVSASMGQKAHIMIGNGRPRPLTEGVAYNTIKSQRSTKQSYDQIAAYLNARSLKTSTLDSWTGTSVKDFFESYGDEETLVMKAGA